MERITIVKRSGGGQKRDWNRIIDEVKKLVKGLDKGQYGMSKYKFYQIIGHNSGKDISRGSIYTVNKVLKENGIKVKFYRLNGDNTVIGYDQERKLRAQGKEIKVAKIGVEIG